MSYVWSSTSSSDDHCIEKERQALLNLKKGFVDDGNRLSSWKSSRRDCCAWRGIRCDKSKTHRHIIALDLKSNYDDTQLYGEIGHSLVELQHLRYLDLSYNAFTEIPEFIGSLTRLRSLIFEYNPITFIPSQLGNLTRLKFLKLAGVDSDSYEISTNLEWLSHLTSLRFLELTYTNLTKSTNWFHLIKTAPSLSSLALYSCVFPPTAIDLDIFSNKNSSNSLTNLDIVYDIGKLHHLEYLSLSSNSFTGLVSEVHFEKLSELKELDLSGNSLTLRTISTWIPPFQLERLSLRSCKLGPQFPSWIKTQINLSYLDISNSEIHSEIPNGFFNQTSNLNFLDLSSNQFHGRIPPSLSNVNMLILSNNRFIDVKSFLCYPSQGSIKVLDISNNMLSGNLPNCHWHMKELIVLKLDNNNLSGIIPRTIGLSYGIQYLLLGHNNFSGKLPSSLKKCKQLQVLDVEYNNLEGNIPSWIGKRLMNLIILRIRSNHFNGVLPSSLCHLHFLQIFDISMNIITGLIPSCIKNFTSMVDGKKESHINIWTPVPMYGDMFLTYEVVTSIMWRGAYREYSSTLGLLRVIDLSSNNLIGKIPQELTNLVELVQLNLSRNSLNDTIPMKIGNLTNLISLDLSHNKLSGAIPTSLASISTLSLLDLSNNKLSGRIPTGTQLQTFNASMYMHNDGLCGPPLTNSCLGDESPNRPQDHSDGAEDSEEWIDMSWLRMGIWVGFVIGFVGVCGNLLLNTTWRLNYFNYMGTMGDWLYVRICVQTNLLKRRFFN
ncbi:hypothetical protein CsatB_015736 [Cannabis sativa]